MITALNLNDAIFMHRNIMLIRVEPAMNATLILFCFLKKHHGSIKVPSYSSDEFPLDAIASGMICVLMDVFFCCVKKKYIKA
jgi:hypothetical protein